MTPPTPTSHNTKPRGLRIRWIVYGLLTIEVLYLLAANLFLQPWAGQQWIRKRPDKLLIEWQAAWTLIPGLVHARGLHLRGRTPKQRWELTLDTLRTWIVPSLLSRQLSAMGTRGSGVDFRLARDPAHGDTEHQAFIEGFAPHVERPPKARRSLTVTVDDAQFDEIREIWLFQQRYEGLGQLTASAHIKTGAGEERSPEISIPHLALSLNKGTLSIDGAETGELARLDANLVIEPHRPKEHRGLAGLRFVSGSLSLEAPRADLDVLGHLFHGASWLDLGGEGAMQADLRLNNGRVLPESWVHAWAGVHARYLDFLIEGQGRVRGTVTENSDGGLPSSLEVAFDTFSIREDNQGEPHAFGTDAVLRAEGRELDLTQPHLDWVVDLNLPSAQVPDLTYYNAYLPKKSSVALLSGKGLVAANLSLDLPKAQVEGMVHIEGNAVDILFQDVEIRGDLAIDTSIRNGDANTQRFDISGTKLRVDNASLRSAEGPETSHGWWGEVRVDTGEVMLDPLALRGRLGFRLRDTGPLVHLLNRGKQRPRWLNRLLEIENVQGHGAVVFHEAAVDLGGVKLQLGERLKVLGELKLSHDNPHFLLFCKYGVLTVALEQIGQQRTWKPIKSLRWYESRRKAWRGDGIGTP